jgi:ABC-type transport system involved in resistance to organic solvents, periplasmic component
MRLPLSKELKLGISVILLGITMFWLVNFLRGRDIFQRFSDYHAYYENIEGINLSSPVFLKGFKIGTVTDIRYLAQKDCFDLRLRLASQYPIPNNSVAQIYSMDLLGSKAIRIQMGDAGSFLKSGDRMEAGIAEDALSSLLQGIGPIKEKAETVLDRLTETLDRLNQVLEEENRHKLESALSHLNVMLEQFSSLGRHLNAEVPQVQSILQNLNTFSVQLGKSAEDIGLTLSNISNFSDSLQSANIADLINHLDSLVVLCQSEEGSIGQLFTNNALYQQLHTLVQSVEELVGKIKENPKKYLKISVF